MAGRASAHLKYARKREWERIHQLEQLTEVELMKRIRLAVQVAGDEIVREANNWYLQYFNEVGISPGEVNKLARKADVLELGRKAKNYVIRREEESFAFSARANKEMKLYNITMRLSRHDLLLRHLNLVMQELGDDLEKKLTQHLTDMTEAELMRQAAILGVTISHHLELKEKAMLIARMNFAGANFSERIWDNIEGMKKELIKGISKSILLGKHPTTWMCSLKPYVKDGVKNINHVMKRLAVTETARAQIQAQKESYDRYGYTHYMVICEPTACDICAPFDGKIFETRNMVPGVNAPTFHPNCKCTTSAYAAEEVPNEKGAKFTMTNSQFGKKAGKHMEDYGLSPQNEDDRMTFKEIIKKIVYNSDEVRTVSNWRGYKQSVLAHIRDSDVVLTTEGGEFITILKGGINNDRIKNARE